MLRFSSTASFLIGSESRVSSLRRSKGVPIPSMAQVKYLGIVLDKRLTWGPHLKSKRKSLNSRSHLLRPILKSKLPIHNKIQIYKSLLRPIWSYGAQIWGCAKPTQIKTIEAFQSISLRTITSAPWFVSNHTLHKDLKIETVENLVKTHYKKFHNKLLHHPNPLIANQHTATIPDFDSPPEVFSPPPVKLSFQDQLNIPPANMESLSSTKVQTPPFYVSEGYEISTLKNALFDITESSSILFKSTPKYLIIHAGTVVAWNTIFKFLADNEQFKFHTHLPKPLKPYSVFIRHLHPSTPVEDIQAYITDKGYAVIQIRMGIEMEKKNCDFFFLLKLVFGADRLLDGWPTKENNCLEKAQSTAYFQDLVVMAVHYPSNGPCNNCGKFMLYYEHSVCVKIKWAYTCMYEELNAVVNSDESSVYKDQPPLHNVEKDFWLKSFRKSLL
ncbi:hypothetical protein QTP88_004414 [Uroleucon formosanum]